MKYNRITVIAFQKRYITLVNCPLVIRLQHFLVSILTLVYEWNMQGLNMYMFPKFKYENRFISSVHCSDFTNNILLLHLQTVYLVVSTKHLTFKLAF